MLAWVKVHVTASAGIYKDRKERHSDSRLLTFYFKNEGSAVCSKVLLEYMLRLILSINSDYLLNLLTPSGFFTYHKV